MNKKNIDKAEIICNAYKNGKTVYQIARAFKQDHSIINSYLQRYYHVFHGTKFESFQDKRKKWLADLYKRYTEVYVKGLFSKKEMCELLDCTIFQLESMLMTYKLKNQWLKTYEGQVTLCNTSKEFRASISEFAKKHGYKSVRAVCVQAINEFMLNEELKKEEVSSE